MTTHNGDRLCWHCGAELSNCIISGMWYPDAPYECPNDGGGMERWEGLAPEEVTDEDRERWAKWGTDR